MHFFRRDLGAAVNRFAVTVLLSVARVRRLNAGSIAALRSAVLGSRRDYRIARRCQWLPDCFKEESFKHCKYLEKALLKIANESSYGREHLVPINVQLGFVLLEAQDGGDDDEGCVWEGLMRTEDLGIQMLKTLFKDHEMTRNEIIEQCKCHILSLKPQQSLSIIKLLGHLSQCYPYPMLENIARLKELLDYFTFMHDKTAQALVIAILPLIRFSQDLQDYIILVARKALFRKEDTVRMSATNAIVDIILAKIKTKKDNLKFFQESSSQASSSQQSRTPSTMSGDLFQELNGLLRRCLSQEARVREIVYHGLMKLVVLDPLSSCSIFDLLWPHFLHFYDESGEFPLKLDACIASGSGKTSSVEPLGSLLSCISWILLLQTPDKSDNPSVPPWSCFGFSLSQENEANRSTSSELLLNALTKVRRSLKLCRLEGQSLYAGSTPLNGDASFSHGILARIIQVFCNVVATELEKTAGTERASLETELLGLINLFDSIQKEIDSGTKLGNGPKKCPSKLPQATPDTKWNGLKDAISPQSRLSVFSSTSIKQLLETAIELHGRIYNKNGVVSQSNSQSPRSNCLRLVKFSLNACLHLIKSAARIDGTSSADQLECLINGDVKELGQPLMRIVWLLHKSSSTLESGSQKQDPRWKKHAQNHKQPFHLALLCLLELLKLNTSSACLSKLLEDIMSVDAPQSDLSKDADILGNNNTHEFATDDRHSRQVLLFLEKQVKPLYVGALDLSLFHEVEVLSELMQTMGRQLPIKWRILFGDWARDICGNNNTENSNAARSILANAIYFSSAPDDHALAVEAATELLKVTGSEDRDPIERSGALPIVNRSTQKAITSFLLFYAESSLVDVEWAVTKLNSALNCDALGQKRRLKNRDRLHELEDPLCSRTEALVDLLSFFTEMNIKDSQAEKFLRITTKLYKLLARITRLHIARKGRNKQNLPGLKFHKLTGTTCKKLTSPLYIFVALIQKAQQEKEPCKGAMIHKIRRESRCISDLVFQIEAYESNLIQLGKMTKVNLLRHAKRSTSRDFKILDNNFPQHGGDDDNDQEPRRDASPSSSQDGSGEESDGREHDDGGDDGGASDSGE